MKHSLRWILFILVTASMVISACVAKPAAPAKVTPAVVETIEGSELKRVTLTQRAAERLGIQTVAVKEEMVARKRTVGGTVMDASELSSKSAIPVTGVNEKVVSVRLSENDRGLFDKSQPALIRPITNDAADSGEDDLLSEPFEVEDADEPGDVDAPMYFKLNGSSEKLTAGQSVFVEILLKGSATPQKIVPYSAVLYDLQGETWVYVSPSALVYTREAVKIDYIDGDMAVLLEGPAAGTKVVTVGAPELFGIDTGVDK